MNHKPILVAEDEDSDAFILRLAFERAKLANSLVLVRDGQQVIDYLLGNDAYADRQAHPLPGLVVLDLKMPRMGGLEVLAWLTQRPEFRTLPAVVLSSSPDQSDVQKAKQAGAQEYFVKPHTLKELVAILETLRSRWLTTENPDPSRGVN